jgi:hypothetical protein
MLGEAHQAQQDKNCTVLLLGGHGIVQVLETENMMLVGTDCGRGEQGVVG